MSLPRWTRSKAAISRERGARDEEDLFRLTPGVQFNKGQPNQALPSIRGIGTVGNSDLLGTQQATTGFYVEDVPFTDPFGFVGNADIAPFDLQRVELLRGPQGVLYGSASLGGAVNYVLNKPDLKGMHASLLGSMSNVSNGGSGHAVYAMLNAPVKTDVAGIRVVAFDRRDAGYLTNLGTGWAQANRLRQRGGRIVGVVQATAGLQLTGTVLTQRTENDDSFAVSPDPRQLTLNTPTASTRSNEFTLRKLQLDMALGGGRSLTSISAVLDKRAAYVTDATRGYRALGSYYGPLLGLGALPTLLQATDRLPGRCGVTRCRRSCAWPRPATTSGTTSPVRWFSARASTGAASASRPAARPCGAPPARCCRTTRSGPSTCRRGRPRAPCSPTAITAGRTA